MKKAIFYIFTTALSLSVLIIFVLFSFNDQKLHIVMCDVGQGDAILISTPNQGQILIDGGPDKSVLDCLSQNMPFWDRSLEAVILTHPHADHYFGLIDVVERYHLNGFYTEAVKTNSEGYKLLEAKLAEKNLSAKNLSINDNLKDKSGMRIKILWPKLDEIEKVDHNNTDIDLNGLSVVALLTYGNFSILLTGDAGENVMNQIANEAGDIDVLKLPHHGSRTGVDDNFLKQVKPEVAVISVGEGNRYGHPARESLQLLESNKVKIFRTDKNGDIKIITDGKAFQIKSSK